MIGTDAPGKASHDGADAESDAPYDMEVAHRLSRWILAGSLMFAAVHGGLIWLKLSR